MRSTARGALQKGWGGSYGFESEDCLLRCPAGASPNRHSRDLGGCRVLSLGPVHGERVVKFILQQAHARAGLAGSGGPYPLGTTSDGSLFPLRSYATVAACSATMA